MQAGCLDSGLQFSAVGLETPAYELREKDPCVVTQIPSFKSANDWVSHPSADSRSFKFESILPNRLIYSSLL